MMVSAVFLDLKRAFETIDRNRLICKLQKNIFDGVVGHHIDVKLFSIKKARS